MTDLIQAHAAFAGLLGFVVAFFGSFLGTNLVVPAGSFLTAMGVLVGAGVISWTILIWAACGASLGMTGCFALGQHFGARVQQIPMLRNRPEFMRRAEAIFEKHGFLSILIGYFSGPLRAPIASIAAIAGMGRFKFELANISSAFIWSAFALGIGAAPGAIIERDSIWLLIAPVLGAGGHGRAVGCGLLFPVENRSVIALSSNEIFCRKQTHLELIRSKYNLCQSLFPPTRFLPDRAAVSVTPDNSYLVFLRHPGARY